jgi:dTDP-4-dehydrorhamnose reductase
MRALVVGVDGGIGAALTQALRQRGDEVLGTTRRPAPHVPGVLSLDLARAHMDSVALPDVDIAFFCAAMTGLAECRKDPDLARRVNATGPARLAQRLVARGTRVLLLSTNAVYDWQTPCVPASQLPCPLTVYGQLKAEAETEFAALGEAAVILRLSKVLTPELKLFCGWIDALADGGEVTAFTDLHLAPIALADAVSALLALADRPVSGLFQISGAKDISYVAAARHLARRLGVPQTRVGEGSAAAAGFPAEEITTFSSLDSSRFSELTGWVPPDPYAVLDRVFGPALAAARNPNEIPA